MTKNQKLRMILIGVALPAIVAVAGAVIVVLSMPDLPDAVAVHWNASGVADGFGPAWILAAIPLLALPYAVFGGIVVRSAVRADAITWSQRGILATAPFLAIVLAVAGAGSALLQRGLADDASPGSIIPALALGLLAGIVASVAAWFVLPRHEGLPAVDAETAPALELGPTERAVWMRRIEPARGLAALIIGGLALAMTAGAIVIWASAPLWQLAVWVGILALVTLAVSSTMFWSVRIDATGVDVRSALGAPHFHYPLDEITAAGVRTVNPTRDFGGWGIRTPTRDRTGIVVRAGDAIEVQRVGGKVLVITVDDAQTGAALLNGLVAQSARSIP